MATASLRWAGVNLGHALLKGGDGGLKKGWRPRPSAQPLRTKSPLLGTRGPSALLGTPSGARDPPTSDYTDLHKVL